MQTIIFKAPDGAEVVQVLKFTWPVLGLLRLADKLKTRESALVVLLERYETANRGGAS
jgi:hypothetical protein